MNNRLNITKRRVSLRSVALICVVINICVNTTNAQNWEIQGVLQTFSPRSSLWDNQADGSEVRAIYWWDTDQAEELGIAFSIGTSQWDVKYLVLEDTRTAGTGRTRAIEGDVEYTPWGLSLVARRKVPDYPQAKATFDVGLHYMSCSSDLNGIQTLYIGGTPLGTDRLKMTCDDGFVGRFGIGLEWAIKRGTYPIMILLNGGYQFDLSTGEAIESSWTNISAELALKAIFFQLGLAIPIQ